MHLRLGQAEAAAWNSAQVFHMGGKDPSTWSFTCCFQAVYQQEAEPEADLGHKPIRNKSIQSGVLPLHQIPAP